MKKLVDQAVGGLEQGISPTVLAMILYDLHKMNQEYQIHCFRSHGGHRGIKGTALDELMMYIRPKGHVLAPFVNTYVLAAREHFGGGGGGASFALPTIDPQTASAVDKCGMTVLHCCAEFGWPELVKLIIDQGANVNQIDEIGNTAVDWAFLSNHKECMSILLRAGGVSNSYTSANTPKGARTLGSIMEGKH